jgi:hypothetical protein
MRLAVGFVAAVLAAQLPAVAGASPVNAHLSPQGLEFVRKQVVGLVPSHIEPDPIDAVLSQCDDGPSTLTQSNTKVDLTLENLTLSTLPGKIRVDLTASVTATGQVQLHHMMCFYNETCGESISVQHMHVVVDFAASVDGAGKPHFAVMAPTVDIKPGDLHVDLSPVPGVAHSCPEADLFNATFDFIKPVAVPIGTLIGTNLATLEVGPLLEQAVASYLSYKGNAAFLNFGAALTGLDISESGITVSGDVDLTSVFPLAACLTDDPGEPSAVAGAAPDLVGGTQTDVALSVNLGLVQDLIYHVWHEGLMCITPDTLRALKVDLSMLNQLGEIMPGFPKGTTWAIEANVGTPPLVQGTSASDAKLAVHVTQVSLDVIASLPDKSSRRLHLDLAATLTASVVIDPHSNALALQIEGATIDEMKAEDHLGLEAAGISITRIQTLLEQNVLPSALGGIGQIPITGPVFGGIADTYVILKELKTTPAYLAVKANLFRAPADDKDAPTTTIDEKPSTAVKPADAKLMFGGKDKQDPTELLQYHVIVDGKSSLPTFVRTLTVGTAGKTETIHVEVHAVDLAGNEDRVGAAADVIVDGVAPTLMVIDAPRGAVDELRPTFVWKASDDRSQPAQIAAHITVSEMGGSNAQIEDKDLGVGVTTVTLENLVSGHQYKAVITVRDEAGNEASSQEFFTISPSAGSGGCAVGHGPGGALSALLVGLALLIARRRK